MKALVFPWILLLIVFNLFPKVYGLAQQTPIDQFPDPYQQNLPAAIQGPTSAAISKFNNFSVDHKSGALNIDIPLFEAKARDLQLPISLSYLATGVKLEEFAGPAGLGWVVNAGGAITRTVRGLPDDYCQTLRDPRTAKYTRYFGWLTNLPGHSTTVAEYIQEIGRPSAGSTILLNNPIPVWKKVEGDGVEISHTPGPNIYSPYPYIDPNHTGTVSARWVMDTEPDIFHIKLPNISASFVFDENRKACFLGHQDIEVTLLTGPQPTNPSLTFLVTDPNGFKYLFNVEDYTVTEVVTRVWGSDIDLSTNYNNINGCNRVAESPVGQIDWSIQKDFMVTAWNLTRIISPSGANISFAYFKQNVANIKQNLPKTRWAKGTCPEFESFERTTGFAEHSTGQIVSSYSSTYYNTPSHILGFAAPEHAVSSGEATSLFKISFIYDNQHPREDWGQYKNVMGGAESVLYRGQNSSKLLGIQYITKQPGLVNPINNMWSSGGISMNIEFQTSYAPSTSGQSYVATLNNVQYYEIKSRLLLDEIRIIRNTPTGQDLQTYSFAYNGLSLPDYDSELTDHWGYYHGRLYSSPHSTIPKIFMYPDLNDHNRYRVTRRASGTSVELDGTSGIDKSPGAVEVNPPVNPDWAAAMILQEVTYPTGGKAIFEFESNSYYDNEASYYASNNNSLATSPSGIPGLKAGGVRIKKITYTDDIDPAKNIIRTYEYTTLSGVDPDIHNSGQMVSSGVLVHQPSYAWGSGVSRNPYKPVGRIIAAQGLVNSLTDQPSQPAPTWIGHHQSLSIAYLTTWELFTIRRSRNMAPQGFEGGAPVYYTEVTVKEQGNGKSIYKYERPKNYKEHATTVRTSGPHSQSNIGEGLIYPPVGGQAKNVYPFPPLSDPTFNSVAPANYPAFGQLKEVKTYKEGSSIPIKTVKYTYRPVIKGNQPNPTVIGGLVLGIQYANLPQANNDAERYSLAWMPRSFGYYSVNTNMAMVVSEVEETLVEQAISMPVGQNPGSLTTIKRYRYEQGHVQPVEIEVTNSDGSIARNRFTFPYHYNFGNPLNTIGIASSLDAKAIRYMQQNNIINKPIEQISTIVYPGGSEEVVSGIVNKYRLGEEYTVIDHLFDGYTNWNYFVHYIYEGRFMAFPRPEKREEISSRRKPKKIKTKPSGYREVMENPPIPVISGRNDVLGTIFYLESVYRHESQIPKVLQQQQGNTNFTRSHFNSSDPNNLVFEVDSGYRIDILNTVDPRNAVILEQASYNAPKKAFISDYFDSEIVAIANNAEHNEVAYSGFEHYGNGNWSYSDENISTTPKTGWWGYHFNPNSTNRAITSKALPAGKYNISYWSTAHHPLTITGCSVNSQTMSDAGSNTNPQANNALVSWRLHQAVVQITGSPSVISLDGPDCHIDELRLFPVGAQMVSYTHRLGAGITTESDINNIITRYKYDDSGRLFLITDENESPVKRFEYKYGKVLTQ